MLRQIYGIANTKILDLGSLKVLDRPFITAFEIANVDKSKSYYCILGSLNGTGLASGKPELIIRSDSAYETIAGFRATYADAVHPNTGDFTFYEVTLSQECLEALLQYAAGQDLLVNRDLPFEIAYASTLPETADAHGALKRALNI